MNDFANTVDRNSNNQFGEVGLFALNRDAEDVIGCFVKFERGNGSEYFEIPVDAATLDEDGHVILDSDADLAIDQVNLDTQINSKGLHGRAFALPNRQDGDVLSVDESVSVLMDLGYSAQRARNLSEIAGGFVVRNTDAS